MESSPCWNPESTVLESGIQYPETGIHSVESRIQECSGFPYMGRNKHAPLRTMRVRTRSSPWITSELKKRMHDRDILKIKASKSNDSNDWSLFKKQRNIVNSEIRLAKQAYYQNSFNKYMGDSKKTWQTINELTSRKSGKKSVTSLKVNGVSITNPTVLSNQFNNHFATNGPELASNVLFVCFCVRLLISSISAALGGGAQAHFPNSGCTADRRLRLLFMQSGRGLLDEKLWLFFIAE